MARLRVATFNTGLLEGGVPWARHRADAAIGAAIGLDADLVSLQEVWEPDDRARLAAQAAAAGYSTLNADPLPPAPGDWGLGGNCGVVLMTRLPVLAVGIHALESTVVRRAVLAATVATGAGPVLVLATHLTAVLRSVVHAHGDGGWAREHMAQSRYVAALAGEYAGGVILAGDLNCGPGREGPDELPSAYRLLRSTFEASPYADDPSAPATWAVDNPLVLGGGGQIIDHVMVSRVCPLRAWRALDEAVALDVAGRRVVARVSDHYAVVVEAEVIDRSNRTRRER